MYLTGEEEDDIIRKSSDFFYYKTYCSLKLENKITRPKNEKSKFSSYKKVGDGLCLPLGRGDTKYSENKYYLDRIDDINNCRDLCNQREECTSYATTNIPWDPNPSDQTCYLYKNTDNLQMNFFIYPSENMECFRKVIDEKEYLYKEIIQTKNICKQDEKQGMYNYGSDAIKLFSEECKIPELYQDKTNIFFSRTDHQNTNMTEIETCKKYTENAEFWKKLPDNVKKITSVGYRNLNHKQNSCRNTCFYGISDNSEFIKDPENEQYHCSIKTSIINPSLKTTTTPTTTTTTTPTTTPTTTTTTTPTTTPTTTTPTTTTTTTPTTTIIKSTLKPTITTPGPTIKPVNYQLLNINIDSNIKKQIQEYKNELRLKKEQQEKLNKDKIYEENIEVNVSVDDMLKRKLKKIKK